MKLSLWHWMYCSLVFSSGVFAAIGLSQRLYHSRQLTSEVAGFSTPSQLADFTLSEIEDLVPVLAPVLTLIYGAIGILRNPTKTLRLTSESKFVLFNIPQKQETTRLPAKVTTRSISTYASNVHHHKSGNTTGLESDGDLSHSDEESVCPTTRGIDQ